VIAAVLASMIVAEQYFSFESLTARSTLPGVETTAGDRVYKVDLREHLRLIHRALRLGGDLNVGDGLATLAQDEHDVKRRACGSACQHHLHRPHAQITAAAFGSAVDDDRMSAPRFADETHAFTHLIRVFIRALPMPARSYYAVITHIRQICYKLIAYVAMRQKLALCAAICEDHNRLRLAVLLLRHRRRIPPFSSYGGILGAVPKTRAFFSPAGLCSAREPGRPADEADSAETAFGANLDVFRTVK
jgi:hypothetical protein